MMDYNYSPLSDEEQEPSSDEVEVHIEGLEDYSDDDDDEVKRRSTLVRLCCATIEKHQHLYNVPEIKQALPEELFRRCRFSEESSNSLFSLSFFFVQNEFTYGCLSKVEVQRRRTPVEKRNSNRTKTTSSLILRMMAATTTLPTLLSRISLPCFSQKKKLNETKLQRDFFLLVRFSFFLFLNAGVN